LNGRRLDIKDTQKIIGLTFDSRLTWKAHTNETMAKAFRRVNLLKCLAGMKWGADQGMMVLSALVYGSAAYELASNAQLKRLQPVHNKGLRIAVGAFCVWITENIMCESLAERRKRKIINTAIHVAENSSHPVNRWYKEDETYEDYALKPKLSRPFFVRALEACSSLEVDLDTMESARQLEHPPSIGDNMENVNTQMTAIPKGTATAIIAEMEQTIEEERFEEYVRVYIDESLMEDRVGCAIICEAREIKIRLPKQMSIFNAETVF
jgi:hypothetical protein